MVPRFLIDDTAEFGEARVFVTHTQSPRFVGELLPEDEAPLEGVVLSGLPDGEVLAAIAWIDPPVFDADDLLPALARAIRNHWSVRSNSGR